MVADGIHILLGVALTMALLRTRRLEPYLIVVLASGTPDLDRYLFLPFIYRGYLSGPLWTHRGITHSLLALVLVVTVAAAVGHWRAGAIGYGSHLAADYATGGIRLFAPFDPSLYGLYFDWMIGNVVVGAFSIIVMLTGLGVLLTSPDEHSTAEDLEPLRLNYYISWLFR